MILLLNSLFKSYHVAKVAIFDVLPSFFGPKAPDDGIASMYLFGCRVVLPVSLLVWSEQKR